MAELVSALRSGTYTQGKQALRTTEDKFCCLGVYCDLRVQKGLGRWELAKSAGYYQYIDESGDSSISALTEMAACNLGLTEYQEFEGAIPEIASDIMLDGQTAISMNDRGNNSFRDIANEIERLYLSE